MCKTIKEDSTFIIFLTLFQGDNSMIGKFMHFYGWIWLENC
jgi:hypothetical protein